MSSMNFLPVRFHGSGFEAQFLHGESTPRIVVVGGFYGFTTVYVVLLGANPLVVGTHFTFLLIVF